MTSKPGPEWSRGKTRVFLQPYWDGHMFVSIYLRHRGFTCARIANALGCSKARADQMCRKAERIIARVDKLGHPHARRVALRKMFIGEDQR